MAADPLHVTDAGDGPPVVLLHGLTATNRYVVMGSRALQRAGHRVESVMSVRDGLELLAREVFDLVVTDMYMPDEDGLDCLRQIRALTIETPVIVMSGQLVGEFGETLKAVITHMGAVAALGKIGDGAELLAVVARIRDARTAQ